MLSTDENSTALSDATPMKRLRVFVSVSAIMVGRTVPAFALSPYDGYWSVVIMTRRGDREPSVRQPVQITNGIVIEPANGMAQIEGRVPPNRAVVTVHAGSERAIGSGRLSLKEPNIDDEVYRQLAGFVLRLLGGAPPGALPVEKPNYFELVISEQTADDIGLFIPESLA
jgi:hypothetical protein